MKDLIADHNAGFCQRSAETHGVCDVPFDEVAKRREDYIWGYVISNPIDALYPVVLYRPGIPD